MPVYEYTHTSGRGETCPETFSIHQSMKDEALARCPTCGQPVTRLLFAPGISAPRTNAELKNLGFSKLVRRDTGVYENVTATGAEKRYMVAGDNSSLPDIKRKIED